jgi:hypothetical protein
VTGVAAEDGPRPLDEAARDAKAAGGDLLLDRNQCRLPERAGASERGVVCFVNSGYRKRRTGDVLTT